MPVDLVRLEATLERGRAAARARMRSATKVRRKTGRAAQDANGAQNATWAVVHASLPFRLDGSVGSDGGSHTVTIAGVTYEQATAVGHFPADTEDLADGDFLEVISGEWAGAVFSIVAAIRADQKTARRVPIAEQPRPTEWAT